MANRPKGYGLDADVARKQEQKYDPVAEQEAVAWLNSVLGGTEMGQPSGKDEVQEKLLGDGRTPTSLFWRIIWSWIVYLSVCPMFLIQGSTVYRKLWSAFMQGRRR